MTSVTRGRHDDSTSNLRRHVLSCAPPTAASGQSIKAYASGTTYNRATHRMKIALWVSRRHRPFAIVGDPELLDIFSDLNKNVETPSASTVSRDVKEIFQWSQKSVAKLLQVSTTFQSSSHSDLSAELCRPSAYVCRWLDLTAGYLIPWYHYHLHPRWDN